MEPSHPLDDLFARPEVEVVGVAQDYLRPGPAYVIGAEATHNGVSADRHECGCLNLAVRQGQDAGASWSVSLLNPELEHQVR
jgi:hypothetical protein